MQIREKMSEICTVTDLSDSPGLEGVFKGEARVNAPAAGLRLPLAVRQTSQPHAHLHYFIISHLETHTSEREKPGGVTKPQERKKKA